MRRSEWIARACKAWEDEPCVRCGQAMRAYHVDEEGSVWSFCGECNRDYWVAHEPIPASFDPEPADEDLPF